MKKVVFFQAYIGVQSDDKLLIEDRLLYLEKLLSFVHHCQLASSIDATFYLVPTCPEFADESVEKMATRYGFSIFLGEFHRENEYEYPGLNALSGFSKGLSETQAILYLHSKGIFNRRARSLGIFRAHVATLFSIDVDKVFLSHRIKKVCLFPSRQGWAWQNFFWVRSDFVKGRNLLKTMNRHYYEAWIGGSEDGYRDCFSAVRRLIPDASYSYFEAEDINQNNLVQSIFRLYSV